MKREQGITLVSLTVTIIILLIILSFAVSYGKNTIDQMKLYQFSSELQIVQKKLQMIYEERQLGSKAYDAIGIKIQNLSDDKQRKAAKILQDEGFKTDQIANFVLLSENDLKQIGVDNIKQEVLINYDIPIAISYTGVEINGISYFK